MTAIEALQEFARRWSRVNGLKSDDLLGGGRRIDGQARYRDALCFVARGLTRARDELLGDAFDMPARSVMRARHRHHDRFRRYPAVEAMTDSIVRGMANDERFIATLCAAVAAEEERRTAIANRSRADALTVTCQGPAFEIGRCVALQRYFEQGGRVALIERNCARALPNPDTDSASA